MDDLELLRRFAEGGEGEAFRELVERHQDWVYSVCRRGVGDAGLAEDAAQGVFLALARKAREVGRREGGIEGWLYEAARFAAANVRRGRARRVRYEQEAGAVKNSEFRVQNAECEEVVGALDGALAKLAGVDRDAVLLRFYRGKSFAEVGAAMGVSEEAAKKRVGRALEKLRGILGRRGIGLPAAGIAGVGLAEIVRPAPSGFAMQVMSGVEGKAASASVLRVMQGILRRRLVMGMKVAAVVVVLAVSVPVAMVAAGGGSAAGDGTTAVAATEPVKADMSTPLGTMHMFNDALVHSDWAELQKVLYAVTPQQQQMSTAMVDTMKRMAELKKELAARFGERAATQSRVLQMGGRMDMELLDADVHIEGEHAEVVFTSVPRAVPFELVKVDGEWRIAVAELIGKQQTPEQEKKYMEAMRKQEGILAGVVADLKAGELTTMGEVNSRLRGRKE